MRTLKQLTTAADFWAEMVEPDYQCFMRRPPIRSPPGLYARDFRQFSRATKR